MSKMKKLFKDYFPIILPTLLIGFIYLKTFIYYQTFIISEFNIPSYLVEISIANCLFVFGKSFILVCKAFFLWGILFLWTYRLSEIKQGLLQFAPIYLIIISLFFTTFIQDFIIKDIVGFVGAYMFIIMMAAYIKDYLNDRRLGVLGYGIIYLSLLPFPLEMSYSVINQTSKEKEFIVYSVSNYIVTKKQNLKTKELVEGFSVKYLKNLKELKIKKYEQIEIKKLGLFNKIMTETRKLFGIKKKEKVNE